MSSSSYSPKDKKDDLNIAPKTLRPWITSYRACPKLFKVPFTAVDLTFAVLSAVGLQLVRLIITPLMIAHGGWPEGHKYTMDAISSVVSMIHAALLVPSLWFCFSCHKYKPCTTFLETPKWHQDACTALINLCIGYMLQDMIVCSLLSNYTHEGGLQLPKGELMFIGHHIICIVYMISTLVIEAGHFSAMMLMLTGEITNPTFNMYLMYTNAVKLDFCCGITPQRYQIITLINAVPYFFFRVFVGPLVVLHLGYDVLLRKEGRENIPVVLGIFFFFCGSLVLVGSIPWCEEAWRMILDALGGKSLADQMLMQTSNATSISN